MPVLLKQYIGWRIAPKLWESAIGTIDYWFKSTILPMSYNIDDYRIIIDETNNPVQIQRKYNNCALDFYITKKNKRIAGR
jgi:hypothetical protein